MSDSALQQKTGLDLSFGLFCKISDKNDGVPCNDSLSNFRNYLLFVGLGLYIVFGFYNYKQLFIDFQ